MLINFIIVIFRLISKFNLKKIILKCSDEYVEQLKDDASRLLDYGRRVARGLDISPAQIETLLETQDIFDDDDDFELEEEDELCGIVKQSMENVVGLEVPLLVEIGKGKTWLDAH